VKVSYKKGLSINIEPFDAGHKTGIAIRIEDEKGRVGHSEVIDKPLEQVTNREVLEVVILIAQRLWMKIGT
jgi:hypothetical protein